MTKLNLGCGMTPLAGYVNIDREPYALTDMKLDMDGEEWPFLDGSVSDIRAYHVLEHMDDLLWVMKECYRVLEPGGLLEITTPHPASEGFWSDPTHKHPITLNTLALFSKDMNGQLPEALANNTQLAVHHGIDFEIAEVEHVLMPQWRRKNLDKDEIEMIMASYNNVVRESRFVLRRM